MDETDAIAKPQWQPLGSKDRRVIGVLAEKAKTTPDAYPLSLNAVCTGCNQKSNRSPVMQLEPDDVEESLDRLREMGAVGIVQGYGRVSKYRHYLYDWLGVDKLEMAVVVELLLRGDQTVGELRGRAARMEPIAGLAELRPILASLKSKGLVIYLTPEGRGHTVTHGLYKPQELERLKQRYAGTPTQTPTQPPTQTPTQPASTHQPPAVQPQAVQEVAVREVAPNNDAVAALARELGELRGQVAQLQTDLEEVAGTLRQTQNELQDLKDALGA
jgi:hypothetical protein